MVFGYNRIPIISCLKGNASESLEYETAALDTYYELLKIATGTHPDANGIQSVLLEEYA